MDPDEVQALIKRMNKNREKQEHLLSVLGMWAQVARQGIAPDTVKSFTFDPALLTRSKLIASGYKPHDMFAVSEARMRSTAATRYHNVVTLKTGERVELDPPIERPLPKPKEE